MGYVSAEIAYGTEIIAKAPDKEIPVLVKPVPLYDTQVYGSKRKQ